MDGVVGAGGPGQRQLGAAKTKDGNVEAIWALVAAKRSARDTKIKTLNQIRHLGFTAPEEIRQSLHGLSARMMAKKVAAMRPNPTAARSATPPKTALRALGRRALELDAERKPLDLPQPPADDPTRKPKNDPLTFLGTSSWVERTYAQALPIAHRITMRPPGTGVPHLCKVPRKLL
jgi:hypothetical protein